MILLQLVPQALHREVLCAVRMDKYCGNAQKQLAETLHCASFISARCIVKRQTEPQITVQNLNIKHALRRGVILTNIDSFDLHPIKVTCVTNITLIQYRSNIALNDKRVVFHIRITAMLDRFLHLLVNICKNVGDILIFVKEEGNR